MTIRVNENKDEAYYEEQASQEEIYLEQVEENLRATLTSETTTTPSAAKTLDDQLNHAGEELLTGDSDDARLSEETITEMKNPAGGAVSMDRAVTGDSQISRSRKGLL
jgi:hypothetical protein